MSNISIDDVRRIAKLSGFVLSDEELEGYRQQFEAILAYIDRLDSVDTSGVEPTYQVTGLQNVMRDDRVIDYGVSREELLKNTHEQQDGQIKVRRVL